MSFPDKSEADAPWSCEDGSWDEGLWTPWMGDGEDDEYEEDEEPGEDDDWEWEYDDDDEDDEEEDAEDSDDDEDEAVEGDEEDGDYEGDDDEEDDDEWEYEDDEDEVDGDEEAEDEDVDAEDEEWEYDDEDEVDDELADEDDVDENTNKDAASSSSDDPRELTASAAKNREDASVLPRADEAAPPPTEPAPHDVEDGTEQKRIDTRAEHGRSGELDVLALEPSDTIDDTVLNVDADDEETEVLPNTLGAMEPAADAVIEPDESTDINVEEKSDSAEDEALALDETSGGAITTNEEAPLHIPLSDEPASTPTSTTRTGIDRQVLWLAGTLVALLLLVLLLNHLKSKRAQAPLKAGAPAALQLTGRVPRMVRVGKPFRVRLAATNIGAHPLDDHEIIVRVDDVFRMAEKTGNKSVIKTLDTGDHRIVEFILIATRPGAHNFDAVTHDKRGSACAGRLFRIDAIPQGSTIELDEREMKGTPFALTLNTRAPEFGRVKKSFVVHAQIQNTGNGVLEDLIVSFFPFDGVSREDNAQMRYMVSDLSPGQKLDFKAAFSADVPGERLVRVSVRDRNNWTAATSHQIIEIR